MVGQRAKNPVRAKHLRIFGWLFCRYTCGTCGTRSRWSRPYKAAVWFMDHSPEGWEVES